MDVEAVNGNPEAAIGKTTRERRRVANHQFDDTALSYAVKRFPGGDDDVSMVDESGVAGEEDDQGGANPLIENDGFGPPPRRHAMVTRSMARFALRAVQGLGREECWE